MANDQEKSMILVNVDTKPSTEPNARWIYCIDPERERAEYGADLSGKWMMFFKKGEEMDGKWKDACELYRQGKLDGITSMKVSTDLDSERSSDNTSSVICFYCGPANDEVTLMTIGKNLLRNLPYNSKFMRYKSDQQTRGGTFATGQKINSMYSIKVSDVNSSASSHTYSNYDSSRQWHAPKRGNWQQQNHASGATASSNQNWRERNCPDTTNWRTGNRNEESSGSYSNSNSRETNWRHTSRDHMSNSGFTSNATANSQNWRRNNLNAPFDKNESS